MHKQTILCLAVLCLLSVASLAQALPFIYEVPKSSQRFIHEQQQVSKDLPRINAYQQRIADNQALQAAAAQQANSKLPIGGKGIVQQVLQPIQPDYNAILLNLFSARPNSCISKIAKSNPKYAENAFDGWIA